MMELRKARRNTKVGGRGAFDVVEAETRQDASSTEEDGFAEGRADGKRWF